MKKSAEGGKSDTKVLNIIRLAVLALSVAFIVMGAFNGSMMDVLNKAIRICTECVGLG
ncbi:MAG: thioredoxin [Oscillospiraceae bacterium]|nr:thioredoxin [Oscillospiraceae bacterium]